MTILQAVFLGILQGLTEFLPISSSGHLVIGETVLGISNNDITFEVFVHFGTLLAVCLAFRRDILALLQSLVRALTPGKPLRTTWKEDYYLRLAIFLLAGSVPAGVVGILFESDIESLFVNPVLVSLMLIITGVILFATHWTVGKRDSIRFTDALVIGFAQALAIIPGISRSGSTISMGMFLGVEKSESARFSFLLSLPAILGATLLKVLDLGQNPVSQSQMIGLVSGTLAAAISGYVAILFLLRLIRQEKFQYFAFYCFLVGMIGIFYFG